MKNFPFHDNQVMPGRVSDQNQWNLSARINNKPVAESMFNITTVRLDTFIVYTFRFKDLFKSSPASLECERWGVASLKIHTNVPAHQSGCRGCILPFVSVNIARLAVNPPLSEFGRPMMTNQFDDCWSDGVVIYCQTTIIFFVYALMCGASLQIRI